jgi:hypothetical protein
MIFFLVKREDSGILLLPHVKPNTACTKMIGAVLSWRNGFGSSRRSMFSTWNEIVSIHVLIACAIPPYLSLSWSVTLQKKMATPEQKAFCVLQVEKNESVVSVQRVFCRHFQSDPPSAIRIRRWYQQFQTAGCLCRGKSAGRPCVSEESVERMR